MNRFYQLKLVIVYAGPILLALIGGMQLSKYFARIQYEGIANFDFVIISLAAIWVSFHLQDKITEINWETVKWR